MLRNEGLWSPVRAIEIALTVFYTADMAERAVLMAFLTVSGSATDMFTCRNWAFQS